MKFFTLRLAVEKLSHVTTIRSNRVSPNRGIICGVTVALLISTIIRVSTAEENNNQHNLLLNPTTRRAIVQLQQPCRLWTKQSLRTTVSELSERFGIPIWIDRRLDPSQLVDLTQSSESTSIGDELSRVADSIGAGAGLVENIYLFAPKDRIARIQKSAVVLHGQLSSAGKPVAKTVRTLQWTEVATYQDVLSDIQNAWGVVVVGSPPHDLLHAGSLPECSLATQLALLLGGFDLEATLVHSDRSGLISQSAPTNDEKAAGEQSSNTAAVSAPFLERVEIAIKPLSSSSVWQDSYNRTLPSEALKELDTRFATGHLQQQSSGWLLVKGETNLHYAIVSLGISSGRRRKSTSDAQQQLYTFNIEAMLPVEAVLQNLAKNFQLQLEWSDQCRAADRSRLVQLKAENVTRRQLLEMVCEQASLRLEQDEKKLIIHPKAPVP